MPNGRVLRSEYEARAHNSPLKGIVRKNLHSLARNMPFPGLRAALYRLIGFGVGQGVRVGLDSYFDDQFVAATSLGHDCLLEPRVGTVVHDETGRSPLGPGGFYRKVQTEGHVAAVTIGSGAIIGARSILLPGVIVGEKAIVQPGSVVSRDVPACSVAGGAPARVLGSWAAPTAAEPAPADAEPTETGERPGQEEGLAMSLLPSNYILQQEYDAAHPKNAWQLGRQYLLLLLARFMLPTRLRVALYRAMGARVGRDVYIGVDTYLDERYPELITFEDRSGPSFRSTFITHGEAYAPDGSRVRFVAPIVVREGAWSGSNVVVYPGVTIGRDVVVGSGSVITEDVPDYAVVVGNPARVIKFRVPESAGPG